MPRFFITVFGCQMNKLDGELLEGLFVERGWDAAESVRDADVAVFLGCSVRQHAEDRLLSRVGRLKFLKRRRPQMVVAVGGCIAQVRREQILKRLPFVDLVVGPGSLLRLPELSEALLAGARRPVCCYE
ncbi:MAG: tRNA (N6-isopentenyl adenosine(37)-C2)-methylthiotransferase MiaB, partial [Planctomycetota bacterium]